MTLLTTWQLGRTRVCNSGVQKIYFTRIVKRKLPILENFNNYQDDFVKLKAVDIDVINTNAISIVLHGWRLLRKVK